MWNTCAKYRCECTQDALKMHWEPITQTRFRGGLDHIWLHSFSSGDKCVRGHIEEPPTCMWMSTKCETRQIQQNGFLWVECTWNTSYFQLIAWSPRSLQTAFSSSITLRQSRYGSAFLTCPAFAYRAVRSDHKRLIKTRVETQCTARCELTHLWLDCPRRILFPGVNRAKYRLLTITNCLVNAIADQ